MKPFFTLLFSVILVSTTTAQSSCSSAGSNYTSAVFFDPAWISGCASGTSCNGGVSFDTRTTCETNTAMDACAPAPSCAGSTPTGSDIWFKFYATSSSVTLNLVQSVSFFASIQAFSGGAFGCNTLTQIACAVAPGVSQGTSVTLSNLTVNNLYYFRVFGTATNNSQRTGVLCFCGTTGLSNVILPVKLLSFTGTPASNSTVLRWTIGSSANFSHFEIEKSVDGVTFFTIGKKGMAVNSTATEFTFTDATLLTGNNFYRLKMVDTDGRYEYSAIVKTSSSKGKSFTATVNNQTQSLQVFSDKDDVVDMFTLNGSKVLSFRVTKGLNTIAAHWQNGMYILHTKNSNEVQKVAIIK